MQSLLGAIDQLKRYIDEKEKGGAAIDEQEISEQLQKSNHFAMSNDDMKTLLESIDQLKNYIDQREKVWEMAQAKLNSDDNDGTYVTMKAEDVQNLISAIDQLKRYIDEKSKADSET